MSEKPSIKIMKNGPYVVSGNVPMDEEYIVSDKEGAATAYHVSQHYPRQEQYSLCRCGQSKKMPYCDGAHLHSNFNGTETASHKPFDEQAEVIEGPDLIMQDVEDLCASARFCHCGGGTWDLVENPDGPQDREMAIFGACNCPAGRLVVRDALTDELIEPHFEPSISILQDPAAGASGPIYVKGGIPITSANGYQYEVRNRVTLCRCGETSNKPFCNGAHGYYRFRDDKK